MPHRKYKLTHGNHEHKMRSMDTKEKKQYTVQELAKIHGITRQAIFKRIKKYKVPTQLFGRTHVIEKIDLHLLKLN